MKRASPNPNNNQTTGVVRGAGEVGGGKWKAPAQSLGRFRNLISALFIGHSAKHGDIKLNKMRCCP